MRASYMVVVIATMTAAALVPSEARAGTTSPLSALAVMPAAPAAAPRGPVTETPNPLPATPGVAVKTKDGYRDTKWHDLNAATSRGYCLASTVGGYRWMSTWGTSSRSTAEDLELDRLVEKDGKVTLERTRLHFEPTDATLTATSTARVELKEIARTPAGIVVWAFREGRDVIVLAKGVDRGVESRPPESDESSIPFVSAEGCPYAGARLDARKPENGSIAQLTGSLPAHGTGKDKVVPQFMVDVSLSRVARDPEPKLAVRVRVKE
ncbi:MAG: hypothetical protein QOI41_5011 [Myxococcales bacterium]|nr:hypothetical protein [Myxococcales bacterium]